MKCHQIRFENVFSLQFHQVKFQLIRLGCQLLYLADYFAIFFFCYCCCCLFLVRSFVHSFVFCFFFCGCIGQMIELNRVDISRTYRSYFCKTYESKNGDFFLNKKETQLILRLLKSLIFFFKFFFLLLLRIISF